MSLRVQDSHVKCHQKKVKTMSKFDQKLPAINQINNKRPKFQADFLFAFAMTKPSNLSRLVWLKKEDCLKPMISNDVSSHAKTK